MTTLNYKQQQCRGAYLYKYARSLPFVSVVKKNDEPVRRYKSAVERVLRNPERSEDGAEESQSE